MKTRIQQFKTFKNNWGKNFYIVFPSKLSFSFWLDYFNFVKGYVGLCTSIQFSSSIDYAFGLSDMVYNIIIAITNQMFRNPLQLQLPTFYGSLCVWVFNDRLPAWRMDKRPALILTCTEHERHSESTRSFVKHRCISLDHAEREGEGVSQQTSCTEKKLHYIAVYLLIVSTNTNPVLIFFRNDSQVGQHEYSSNKMPWISYLKQTHVLISLDANIK